MIMKGMNEMVNLLGRIHESWKIATGNPLVWSPSQTGLSAWTHPN